MWLVASSFRPEAPGLGVRSGGAFCLDLVPDRYPSAHMEGAPAGAPGKPGASLDAFQVCCPASLLLPHRMAVDMVISRCLPRRCLGDLRRLLNPTEPQLPHLEMSHGTSLAGLPPLPYLSPHSGVASSPGCPYQQGTPLLLLLHGLPSSCDVSAPTPASQLPGTIGSVPRTQQVALNVC